MSDCPFCKRIAAGEYGVSDSYAVSFEPLSPLVPGHLLVVPRKHVTDAGSSPLDAAAAMHLAAQIAGPLKWADSYNIITSSGPEATQSVYHMHLHIVPRRAGDGLLLPWGGQHARYQKKGGPGDD